MPEIGQPRGLALPSSVVVIGMLHSTTPATGGTSAGERIVALGVVVVAGVVVDGAMVVGGAVAGADGGGVVVGGVVVDAEGPGLAGATILTRPVP
jgi:hypothetical protein